LSYCRAKKYREPTQVLMMFDSGSSSQVREGYDWSAQVGSAATGCVGVGRARRRNNQGALRLMRAAADLEDKTDKHPVTPGPVLPARELFGELFMELDQPALALPQFEAVLLSSPNRFKVGVSDIDGQSEHRSGRRSASVEPEFFRNPSAAFARECVLYMA
jgi:hypothetical protein